MKLQQSICDTSKTDFYSREIARCVMLYLKSARTCDVCLNYTLQNLFCSKGCIGVLTSSPTTSQPFGSKYCRYTTIVERNWLNGSKCTEDLSCKTAYWPINDSKKCTRIHKKLQKRQSIPEPYLSIHPSSSSSAAWSASSAATSSGSMFRFGQ